jgi:hypothetical protein
MTSEGERKEYVHCPAYFGGCFLMGEAYVACGGNSFECNAARVLRGRPAKWIVVRVPEFAQERYGRAREIVSEKSGVLTD